MPHIDLLILFDLGDFFLSSFWTAEELLLKQEDDELVLTIVSVENLHVH